MKHLWEVDHPYYCNQGNYFANVSEVHAHYKTLADFLTEEGDADLDMNLVFRWDWNEDDGEGKSTFTGDPYYRNGELLLFFMGQRKGLYRWATVEVCRADEAAVIDFLRPRWEHMRLLWEPLAEPAAPAFLETTSP